MATSAILHTDAFTHRSFYTQNLLHTEAFDTQRLWHTEAFTHRSFYTNAFTHRSFYTQKLLHIDAFTHRNLYTQKLLHTETFTHRSFLHADAFAHRSFYTQELLHKEAFTHRSFYTQKLLHTEAFTHRNFYTQKLFTRRRFCTQKLLHTGAFTQRSFYTQKLLHTEAFYTETLFWHTDYKQKYHFTSVFDDQTFRAKGCAGPVQIAILSQFLATGPHFVRKGCVSCRLVGIAPRLKREIERRKKQEGKRAREQEGKRECEDVKMRRCGDVKMWRWEDAKMRRWADVKMRRCEDVKMWGCGNEKTWGWLRMWGCEDLKMLCEDVKMLDRPPLLEEPFAQTLSGKINSFFREKLVFCKEAIFCSFCQVCTNLSKSGGPVSNFCFTTCSNFILKSSEICQTERTIETAANVITHDSRILHRLHVPPMLRTFPSAGLEVVKKSLWIRRTFQKSPFQTWTHNSSHNLHCFLFLWIGQLPVPSCKTTSGGASKLDVAAVHSQRQKKHILSTG